MRGIARDATERQRLITAYRASGLSARAFSEREGVPESTLYGWLAGRGARSEIALRIARVLRKPAVHAPAFGATGSPLVLQLGTMVHVAVRAGFDRQALDEVLDVMSARQGGER